MAVVVVFWPMQVYSTSSAALRNPIGIRHVVVELTDKTVWKHGPPGAVGSMTSDEIEGARTACGSVIGFRLFDTEVRHGRSRPTEMCKKCAVAQPRDMVPLIGIHVGDWGDARELHAGSGQGSLLS